MVLEACRGAGIKLSLAKLSASRKIKFAGFIIGADGISPDPAKLASLRNFPTPTSITELRSFLGLANQLGSFLPDLAHATVEMRKLLKKDVAFLWLDIHHKEFERASVLLYSAGVVKPFDVDLPNRVVDRCFPPLRFRVRLGTGRFYGRLATGTMRIMRLGELCHN